MMLDVMICSMTKVIRRITSKILIGLKFVLSEVKFLKKKRKKKNRNNPSVPVEIKKKKKLLRAADIFEQTREVRSCTFASNMQI